MTTFFFFRSSSKKRAISNQQQISMSRLPLNYECPVDWHIIRFCSDVAPFFHSTGHTANLITFEGALSAAYSLYLLKEYRVAEFAAFYALSYVLDCLDGHFARRYKMVSKFGEYFDHVKDLTATMAFFYVLWKYYYLTAPAVALFTIAGSGLLTHMGLQQKYLKSKGTFLDVLQQTFAENLPVSDMKYTRWLGCGTFMLISIAIPFFLQKKYI